MNTPSKSRQSVVVATYQSLTLDKRTCGYADAYSKLARFIQEVRDRKVWTNQLDREFEAALAAVDGERDKLVNEPEIQEELNGN